MTVATPAEDLCLDAAAALEERLGIITPIDPIWARDTKMPIERLAALDRFMLGVSATWPQDVGALVLLDGDPLLDEAGRFRIERVRDAFERRLHLVPRFRQLVYRPRRGLGPPLWVDAPTFDLSHHVRELRLEPPAGEAELLRAVEQLRAQRLDPVRPLWEMWFLTGLPDRRIGLFVKIHHAVADGMAAMLTTTMFLDRQPDPPAQSPSRWTPAPVPTAGALLADNLRLQVAGLVGPFGKLARPRATLRGAVTAWPAVRELFAEEPGPETSLDRVVGPARTFSLVRSRLSDARETARAHDATLNDLLLAVTAGGLAALLRSRGEPIAGVSVPVYVPVSLRRHLRGPQQGNLIAQMVVRLPLDVPDPGQRLRRIAADTATRKARRRPPLGALFGLAIMRRLMLKAVMRERVNVTTASLPGPRRPLYLAGARVLEVFPLLPLIANEALGVGAVSYAGTWNVGIAADRDAYPDVDVFAAAVRRELYALGVSTGPAPARPEVDVLAAGAELIAIGRGRR